jgi:hypothetical protein
VLRVPGAESEECDAGEKCVWLSLRECASCGSLAKSIISDPATPIKNRKLTHTYTPSPYEHVSLRFSYHRPREQDWCVGSIATFPADTDSKRPSLAAALQHAHLRPRRPHARDLVRERLAREGDGGGGGRDGGRGVEGSDQQRITDLENKIGAWGALLHFLQTLTVSAHHSAKGSR